jgi:DNA-binding response OmpR family regulator
MADIYSILLAGLGASEEDFVSKHFSGLGHGVFTAKNTVDALEILKAQKIDIYYFQAAADHWALREIEETSKRFSSVAVVLVCARQAESFILKAWHAGAADIIFLPLTP